jgi:hypothetical protein
MRACYRWSTLLVQSSQRLLRRSHQCFSTLRRISPVNTVSCRKHLLYPEIWNQSVHCIIWYFLIRIRIANCHNNSTRQFQHCVIFENKHTFCSWMHNVRTCTTFAQLVWATAKEPEWPWLQCNGGDCENLITRGRRTCFWFHICIVVRDCYWVAFCMLLDKVQL